MSTVKDCKSSISQKIKITNKITSISSLGENQMTKDLIYFLLCV